MTSRQRTHESKDERYLQSLFDSLLSTRYARGFMRRDVPLDQLRDHFETWVAMGAMQPHQWAELVEYNEEVGSSARTFRGTLIDGLRESALSMAGPDRGALESIPVGMFPLETFNGKIFITPHGGAVVVLNEAVVNMLGHILRCVSAIAVRRLADPLAAPAYVDVLVGIAGVATTGDMMASLRPHHLDILTTFTVPEDNFTDFAIAIEEFILLHEYGHFLHSHLDRDAKRSVTQGPEGTELLRTQRDEFEADEYAVGRLLSRYPEEKVAIACGILMRFLWLCEVLAVVYGPASQTGAYLAMMSSHPPAYIRWERIKSATNVVKRDDFSNEIDEVFAYIASIAGVIMLHERLVALADRRWRIAT